MQYKQARRILTEIALGTKVPPKIVLAAARLLIKDRLPTLGPYRKRSPQQVLWRLASDSSRHPNERWGALQKLLSASIAGIGRAA